MIRTQLQAVGLKIKPTADQWDRTTSKIQGTAEHGIHLLGWTGDYNDTDNFLGLLRDRHRRVGFTNQQLFDDLKRPAACPRWRSRSRSTRRSTRGHLRACRWPTRCRPWAFSPDVATSPAPSRTRPEHHLARPTPARRITGQREKGADAALRAATPRPAGARARGLCCCCSSGSGPARGPGAGPPGEKATPEGLARVTEAYGFDEPVLQQYRHLRDRAAPRRLRQLHPDRATGDGELPR